MFIDVFKFLNVEFNKLNSFYNIIKLINHVRYAYVYIYSQRWLFGDHPVRCTTCFRSMCLVDWSSHFLTDIHLRMFLDVSSLFFFRSNLFLKTTQESHLTTKVYVNVFNSDSLLWLSVQNFHISSTHKSIFQTVIFDKYTPYLIYVYLFSSNWWPIFSTLLLQKKQMCYYHPQSLIK